MNISTLNETVTIEELPPVVDYSFRVVFLLIHSTYFLIVALSDDLKKISLVHVHHINLIGLLTAIHYCIWIAWTAPNTGNPIANSILCHISEAFWALSKFARCYSILALAIYRLIAVFRVNLFKKITDSIHAYVLTISLVWIVAAIIFVVSKFTSNTQPGLIMCYDGYSTSIESSIVYYILTSLFGYLLPVSLIIAAYVCIKLKLSSLDSKLHSTDAAESFGSTVNINSGSSKKERKKEKSLAKQFIFINIFEMGSCVFFVLLSLTNVITVFDTRYYFARQLFRIANLVCQSMIPIVSLIYSPIFKKIKDFIC